MRTEKKAAVQNGVARLVLTVAIIALEFYFLYAVFVKLYSAFAWIHTCVRLASLVVTIIIFGERRNAGIKMPWIFLILLFPEFGLLLYALGGRINVTKRMRKRYAAIDKLLHPMMAQDAAVAKKLRETDPALANICHYVRHCGPYPVYDNTAVQFFDLADKALDAMKDDLRRAKHFIFMEYFAIEDAEAFAGIYHILRQKVKEGVEVRLFYDDIGSIGFINQSFIKRMASDGIQCRDFNPVIPLLNVFMNNRDHRKFTVIDGKVAYSGGYNLANEYFNITHPYGYWKDSGVRRVIMLTGDRKSVGDEVGKELGIDQVYSELLPQDKVAKVEDLLKELNAGNPGDAPKKALAFVGDGINDAPVLMRSDVGIAMGSMGSDAAIEAADVVIMDDNLRRIPPVIRIARKTLRLSTENIVFALVVKVLILILGALGIANMWAAVFADVGVACLCILNSMRLLRVKMPEV